jgi:pimeloyl-ACP methyl ester carboxylesterase
MSASGGRPVNDLAELKEYVRAHARVQRIPDYQALLDRVRTDEGDGAGSWVGEWCRAGEAFERQDKDLEAARHYAMARFPYVNGPERQEALERCVAAVDRWRSGNADVEPLDLPLDGGQVRCWTSGLSTKDPKPLLIVMGGIVSVKEQWAPTLAGLRRLGVAGLVTELPSVGENTLRYQQDSWRMLSGILDAVADRADVSRTYAIALSFSGHLALRCAMDDPRIRAIVTVGAPVNRFFTDAGWQRQVPRITVDTLAHMMGTKPDDVIGGLDGWELDPDRLGELAIPVSYGASLRDEIIPAADWELLRERVPRAEVMAIDDVHGSPNHVAEMHLWTVRSLLRAVGARGPQSAVIGMLLAAHRLRRRLSGG